MPSRRLKRPSEGGGGEGERTPKKPRKDSKQANAEFARMITRKLISLSVLGVIKNKQKGNKIYVSTQAQKKRRSIRKGKHQTIEREKG